ncbi:amino acid adenylation domain-containing protein [Rhodococcus ruber]|uniref:Amino acid adenylation domain-containing protein n=1 Tax=Rhodococcus ruber TaxID=1830 RepID=A0ABT4M8M0_9NOCA|nr:non-ribosomal peptide synthetase [Rhodococcus ruber]MCZ4517305.1 amino acid adenylation domain-containing protein [Rhodococcus ruber]
MPVTAPLSARRGESLESVDSLTIREEELDRTSIEDTDPFPLTAAQRGLWFAQHLLSNIPITIANYLDIRGAVDLELMRYAGRRTAREFGAGSLRLLEIDGEPHQYIDVEQGDDTVVLDFRNEVDPESAAREWMRASYSAAIDLTHGRLIKGAILRISDDRTFWYSHVHHIVLDGYGAVQFMRRVASIYTDVSEGREPAPSRAGSLGEVYATEAHYRQSPRFAKDRRYWQSKTADLPPPPSITGGLAPPAACAHLSGGYLPDTIEQALDSAANRLDSAFAPLAIAAVATFLARMTGNTDVVLSLPVAGRTTALLRRSGGMVSNVLPIRVRITPQCTPGSLVADMQLELTGALRHQRYRAEDIRRDAGAGSETRGFFGPAINIMAYETEVAFGPLTGEFNVLSTGPVQDLSINIYPASDGTRSRLEFEGNPNIYGAEQFADLHRRFLMLFERFLTADSDTPVLELDVLDAAERSALVPLVGPEAVVPALFPDLLRRGVIGAADNIAVEFQGESLTYRELDRRANTIARALIARGAGPGSVVAVALPRGIASIVALWAVAASGATFVPIDPGYPTERIAHMLVDSAATIGISEHVLSQHFSQRVCWIDTDDAGFREECEARSTAPITDADRPAGLTEQHAAYMIYTSGSTGTPKGVLVTHAGLATFAAQARPELRVTTSSRLLRFSSSSFDASLFEMIQAFSAGATMVVAPPTVIGGGELTHLLRERRVTHIICAPALLTTVDATELEDLDVVVVGGDVMPPDLVDRFGSKAVLFNSYGPTETTIVVTMTQPQTDTRAITIGRPVEGSHAVVLDALLRPVPPGSAGELYLGGPGVARGYHNRTGLSAARFVADPFGHGRRLYRTGDIVRWTGPLNAAELEFIGRSDFQVQIHGQRIELGEIDAVLSRYEAVDFAVSVVHRHGDASILVSYVKPAEPLDHTALRAFASRFLPMHMVPGTVVELDAIPLTPTGKVDRSALPQPTFESDAAAYRAPASPVETVLADAMAVVLQRDSVSVDDSFFALGGDSIIAIQLVARAKSLGVVITTRDVFERRTVAALAEVATDVAHQVTLDELAGGGVGDMPLTPIMSRTVRSLTRADGMDAFHQTVVLTAPVDLELDGLRRTVAAILDHHDALRSTLTDDGLTIRPTGSVDLDTVVSRVSTNSRPGSREFTSVLTESARVFAARLRPREGVMLQVVWVSPETGHPEIVDTHGIGRIIVIAHHLVIDGVSWRILIPDLAAAWHQVQSKSSALLQPVGTSMRRWAHGLREVAARSDSETASWTALLDGPHDLIGSRPLDPTIDIGATRDQVSVELTAEVTDALIGPLTRAYRGTVEDILLTALALAVWSERPSSFLVSVESHGRDEDLVPGADLSRTVGWFTSIHPVRLSLDGVDADRILAGDVSVSDAVKRIKEQIRALPGTGSGFGLLRYLNDDTSAVLAESHSPQISFNYLGRISTDIPDALRGQGWIPDASIQIGAGSGDRLPVTVALDINAVVTNGRLRATFAFPRGVLDRAEVESVADRWTSALARLAEHATEPEAGGLTPSDVPLVHVDQHQIDRWECTYGELDDIWPLAPLQHGLMFHSELTRGHVDVYTAQLIFELGGEIDAARLHRAARRLLARHDSLRTAFVRDNRGAAAALVLTDPELHWRTVDAEATDVPAIAHAERTARFDLDVPPLLRFVLVNTEDGASLVVTNHHILFDGWSMPIFVKELLVLYAADGPIPIPARTYRDYLKWLDERDHTGALDKWADALAGVDEPSLIAPGHEADHEMPAELSVPLDDASVTAVKAAARDLSVTVNTVVQAAWALVLAAELGRDDVVFGATVSGRPADLTGVEDTLGLFINTLPVRVRVHRDDTVAALLARVQAQSVDLLDSHHMGLPEVRSRVGAGAGFDTLTVFESYPVDHSALDRDTDIAGLRVRDLRVTDATHYPLTLITVLEPTVRITLKHAAGTIDRSRAASIAERFRRALDGLTGDPQRPVTQLDLLSDDEHSRRAAWNRTDHPVAAHTLVELLAAAADEHATATAAMFEGKSLTYVNFWARVRCLARYLRSIGIGPDDVVGVAMPRSLDQLVAVHAVVAAGGAYLPVDPSMPRTRLEHLIATASPSLILGALVNVPVDVVDLDSLDLSRFGTAPLDPLPELRPDHAAYVLFTSGSTGKPKGVTISHRAIVNRLLWMQHQYPLTPRDVVLHKTPATFDVSVWELFWPLLVGATTVIAEPDGHRDPMYLSVLIREHSITTAHFVPSMLELFLTYGAPDRCTSLRQVFASGEALPRAIADRFHGAIDGELHNLYGPTEAAVDVTYHRTRAGDQGPVPIGAPVWNTTVHVLNSALRPVPVGVTGELYLGGVQLARGYAARPDLTAARFVAADSGTRLYRTGDLVRWSEDGSLQYLGRNDFQVKLRGQRLEPGEVEAALLAVDGVHSAVAVVRSNRLVAYIVGTADTDVVAAHAARTLPEYMVPSTIVVLDAMPLGTTGKLDRTALPDPLAAAEDFTAPAGDSEEAVAQIFSVVLATERVSVTRSWFALGGDSLTATQVIARINAELDSDLGVRDLFEAPTVRLLAHRIGHGGRDHAITVGSRPGRIPLSPAQHRMWLLNRFDPSSGAYNIAAAFRVIGSLDVDALRTGLADVVERHEILRTVYPDGPDGPQQVVTSEYPDVTVARTTEPLLDGALYALAAQGFDVTLAPPLRVAVLEVSPEDHVLVVVAHHIAADGWSMKPLARDVMIAYGSRAAGHTPQWTPLPVQYADYALWTLDRLGAEHDSESIASQQIRYWTAVLDGVPERLALPTDRPHPPVASHRGGRLSIDLEPGTAAAMTSLAERSGSTRFMIAHAALAVTLARVSGTRDITIGTPVAGRGQSELDDLVGMFVGTLVLRSQIEPSDTFIDILSSVRERDLDAYANADIPFERLVEVLQPPRSTAYHPLFQVMLSIEETSPPSVELPNLSVRPLDTAHVAAKFDLHVTASFSSATASTETASVEFVYATDLFDSETVEILAERYRTILASALADPDRPVGDIPILTADEPHRIHGAPALAHRTLPDLLAGAVMSAGGSALALEAGGVRWTYSELDDAATVLARKLIRRGIGPEQYVAIALRRGPSSILATWAVAKTGAAFVPIDPTYPTERLTYMLADSTVVLGITDDLHLGSLPTGAPWISIDEVADVDSDSAPVGDLDRTEVLRPDHPAYMIYTSGTTGQPKGVVVSHRGLVNLVADLVDRFELDNFSRALHFASPSFDASVLELLLAIGAGSTMVIADADVLGGSELAAVLQRATHAFVTPAALATVDPSDVTETTTIVVGGEACPPTLADAWSTRLRMFNGYGPTETTIFATIDGPLKPGAPVSIGGPVRGVESVILDDRLHPVPTGSVGELYLTGDGVARGYHRRFALTATCFVADHHGRRLYRTGDLVRLTTRVDPAGSTPRENRFEYIGRRDAQVKVRGFRVELGEIDAVLADCDGVLQSVSAVIGSQVVGYVVPAAGRVLDPELLRQHARRLLPTHMVPQSITVLDALPRTGSGKIDRAALPTPTPSTGVFTEPATATERIVADAFAVVLGAASVGAGDDFFALGGTSLSATRVIAHINDATGTVLPVRAVFESTTVRSLAVAVDSAERSALPRLVAGPRPSVIPLSFAQMRMWLLNRFDPTSAAYNIAFAVRLDGAVDGDALQLAVDDVLARHESLRTYFPVVDGDPAQVISENVELDLRPVDVDDSEVLARVAAVIGRGFDVTDGVPLRGALLRTGPSAHVLVLVVHHISADGLSMTPLARDVALAYGARSHGTPPQWTPLPVQYADFAVWQRRVLGSENDPASVLAQQIRYWTQTLADLPAVLDLPTDRPRPAVASKRGRAVQFTLSEQTTAGVRSLARTTGASVFMVLHAAYSALLARLTGSTDIPVGTPVSGRGSGALDDVVGMFVNTLVLRLDVDPNRSFTELVAHTRTIDLAAMEHSDVPFERVVEAVAPARSTAHSPLFQALIALETERPTAVQLPGLEITPFPYESEVTRFDLALTVTDSDLLGGSLRYATDLFDEATAGRFVDEFTTLLDAALADPSAPVGDLAPSHDAVLHGPVDAPVRTLGQLIDDAVAVRPDAVALRWNGVDYTYGQADAYANRLARVLLGYGVGPETVVAVALPRSAESVLCTWAVTRTGAAYLPIDPAYPAERIAHMIADSDTVLGLTSSAARRGLPSDVPWVELDDPVSIAEFEHAAETPIAADELTGPVCASTAAYVIYTSGSTGRPKGVVVSHRGLANLAASRRELHRVEPSSRLLHNTSPSFDMAVGEMISALSAAATLVVSPPTVLGGAELAAFIRDEQITHALMTPSALSTLDPEGLDCLEVLCVGGEACTAELVAKWSPGRLMLNGYGPTEATDISTLGEVRTAEPITLGRPLHGLRAMVLDARLHPVPVGVRGELYVAGPALARGYHRRSGLTATRFVADPLDPGMRMYRTGDLVRRTVDGRLLYSGRSDQQVKIRGFRIEPGEIDAVLGTHAEVDVAVTLAVPGPAGEQTLVSYITGTAAPESVREHARRSLPAHMVPSAVTVIDQVPRTGTGKLDVAALPVPIFGSTEYRPARTASEIAVVEAFEAVLNAERIGLDDNFFDLGGSSLSAMRVIGELRERSYEIGMQSLLMDASVSAVAERITSDSVDAEELAVLLPLRQAGERAPVFCIHPILGLSWCYSGLGSYIDNPLYGLQTPAPKELPPTLAQLASRYLEEVIRVAPDGPVHLLGWSLGGVLAHEMAVQLSASGRTVASLTLLDAHHGDQGDWSDAMPVADLVSGLGLDLAVPDGQVVSLDSAGALLDAVDTGGIIGRSDIERLIAAAQHNHRLLQQHRPSVYPGDVLYVAAGLDDGDGVGQWYPHVAGSTTVVSAQATHWQMCAPSTLAAIGPRIAHELRSTEKKELTNR